ncbi:MAG: PD40 domain-containing protein [Planctomycetes bacterium]|nr:PD40 domain-containing protein [Planctomycetota bacterium]
MKFTRSASIGTAIIALSLASHAAQAVVKRVRLAPGGAEPNDFAWDLDYPHRTLSADGRFCAVASFASNLVAGDTNGRRDIFVHDRLLHVTRLVSVSTSGVQGDRDSQTPSISDDGNLVAFFSASTNLVSGPAGQFGGIFVRDVAAGTTTRENFGPGGVDPNVVCTYHSLSGDGQRLLFLSQASNLAPNDTQGFKDVFVRDRVSGAVSCVSVNLSGQPGNGPSETATISRNGQFVVFQSFANDLVAGDTNDRDDIFVRDLASGVTELITHDVTIPWWVSVGTGVASDDGRFIAFSSSASSLVLGDWNGMHDVFLRDRQLGLTTLVSATSSGLSANGPSSYPIISPDGSVVVFQSKASNLTLNDANGQMDIFLWERVSGVTSLVSASPDGVSGTGTSSKADLSANGRTIVFKSTAVDLVGGTAGIYEQEFVSEVGALSLVYCSAGTSSNGCVPSIGHSGAPSATAASSFQIRVSGTEGLRAGMIFYSVDNGSLGSVPWGATSSNFCVKLPVQRTPVHSAGGSTGACNGQLQLDWNAFVVANSGAIGAPFNAGTTIHAQGWYRDPANAKTSSLSDALAIEMNP